MKYKLTILTISLTILSCVDAGRKAEYFNNIAYEQLISGDYSGALNNYNKAFALDSTIADFYFYHNRGVAKKEMGDSIATLDDWEKAIHLDGEPLEVAGLRESLSALYSNMGVTADTEGRYLEALENYNQAIVIDPTDAVNYLNRGATYEHLSDYNNAEKDFLKAIALDSTDARAYYSTGLLMGIMDEYDKALHYFLKYIELNPTDDEGYAFVSWILYDQKKI